MNLNAAVNGGLIFPISGYQKTIKDVPIISKKEIKAFYQSKSKTHQHYNRSYKFLIEEYIVSDSLMSKADYDNDRVFVKAMCFKSQKKNENPYTICAAMKISCPVILDEYCACPAGVLGTCNHGIALLRLIAQLRSKNVENPPQELSCTDKPQQWNRPRGKKITPFSVIDVNFQAPKEDSHNKPILCKMYNATSTSLDQNEVSSATKELIKNLNASGVDDGWASILPQPEEFVWVKTRMGYAPEGSPLSFQLSLNEDGFEVIHNLENLKNPMLFAYEYVPRDRFEVPTHSYSCGSIPKNSFEKFDSLKRNEVTIEGAKELEMKTRDQSESLEWKEARTTRLNSSTFGLICKRKHQVWTQVGVRNIVKPKDIGHLNAIKYGKRCEIVARNKYREKMHCLGHDVTVHSSGYIVNPSKPWLGASPDGLVEDPKEADPYGLIEIKCPWSIRDKNPTEVLNGDFRVKMMNGKPVLNENDDHFYQIMGQMALSGLKWCDYVTYFPAGLIIVRVRFNQEKWEKMESILKSFFFVHALPTLAKDLKY